jgi:hypothetical protein
VAQALRGASDVDGIASRGKTRRPGGEATAVRAGSPGTLRDALRDHPAGPELLAVLENLADRPLPTGWPRWGTARREAYLDAVAAEAWTQRAGPSDAGHGAEG